jgi:hypothetical protein
MRPKSFPWILLPARIAWMRIKAALGYQKWRRCEIQPKPRLLPKGNAAEVPK